MEFPYVALHIANKWLGWKPLYDYIPPLYYRDRGRGWNLANPGERMMRGSTHIRWGFASLSITWP